jgi:hypothetical protein
MVFGVALALSSANVRGQSAWYEGFEGPQTSWRPAGGNGRFQIELHQRTRGEAHTGDGCERLRISATNATAIYLSHDIGRARIIDELLPSLQLRSDRAGLQILARVVLPHTEDPRSGRAATTLLAGSTYNQVGHWQQLRLDNLPQLLNRQVRVLRTQLGPNVDPREAYVDQIFLNVYGGPGYTNVWIDDLDIAGYAETAPGAAALGGPARNVSLPAAATSLPQSPNGIGGDSLVRVQRNRIQLTGSILLVEGQPTLVRAIQYQGEPLALLRRLGFNAVWLPQLPATALVDEARQLGMWIVCPPPRPPVATGLSPADDAISPIGPAYDRVIVWDLGGGLSNDRFPMVRQWAEQVRIADRQTARPLICRPESELRGFSRIVDLLVIGRSPLCTSLELTDYGTWVRERPRLARPGTPIWTTVQTQPPSTLLAQWQVFGRGEPVPSTLSSEQIRLMVYTAIVSGSRGLLFESCSPLSGEDADTRQRAVALELLNLELDLIEPWLAAGTFVAIVPGSEPRLLAGVLQTERARLLVPLWSIPGAQFAPGQSAANSVSFVIPGVPESNNAYLLSPGELQPLKHKRVTGGTRVTLDEFGLTAMVLLTQDPLIANSLTRRAAQVGPRAAELQRQLATIKLQEVQQLSQRLAGANPAVDTQVAGWLSASQQSLQRSDGFLAARQYASAYLHAERGMRPLRMAERSQWQATVAGLRSPVTSPTALCFRTLPWHRELMARVGRSPAGENRLPEGQFEDLGSMLQAGWNHFQHPAPAITSEANLAPAAAHSGQMGLRLAARPNDPEVAQALVESPPVWISSPGVPLEAGQVVLIHGWVQIPTPLTGSVDGLLILDSVSGEPLAERIGETVGWQEFTLYRAAPQAGSMSLTFALSGLGEVWLDDVTIQPLP